ncbi:MAG: FkbM family methyltransferase [Elusimicrobiales bacterium]|nr:FkbM family methyltransferase [Elusimicrobiales bacterium]
MRSLRNRHGRPWTLAVSGRGGSAAVEGAALDSLLRLKGELRSRPGLCRPAAGKIFGFLPELAELRFGNRSRIIFNVPQDACAFFSDLYGIVLRDQYGAASSALAGKTVVDAGANIGVFSLYAFALGAKRIHAFEPVAETRTMLEANLALSGASGAVKVYPMALGSKPGKARILFNEKGEGSAMLERLSAVVNEGVSYSGRRVVPVAALDGLRLGRVDFVKIDAEGAEREILLGASRLIKRHKPALSFASYHRPSDKLDLPAVVRGIRPDYRITLNSHAEDDIFCR